MQTGGAVDIKQVIKESKKVSEDTKPVTVKSTTNFTIKTKVIENFQDDEFLKIATLAEGLSSEK